MRRDRVVGTFGYMKFGTFLDPHTTYPKYLFVMSHRETTISTGLVKKSIRLMKSGVMNY